MREKNKPRLGKGLRRMLVVLIILVLGSGIGLLFTPIFHVTEVFCEGNNRISQEEILQTAQIQVGNHIFSQRTSEIEKRLMEIPLMEEAQGATGLSQSNPDPDSGKSSCCLHLHR